MAGKSKQLQIRVTPQQKAALKRLAKGAGISVAAYVLTRALPPGRIRFGELMRALEDEEERRFALAELNDLLSSFAAGEFREAVNEAPPSHLTSYLRNYVAAMVEQAAHQKAVPPPVWTREIEPLDKPRFAVPFPSLRLHLLRAAPIPFRLRNIFVDSAVGDRV